MVQGRKQIGLNRTIILNTGLLWLVFFLGGCGMAPSHPQARDGVLDLRGWDFAVDGPVRLDGEWDFYWGRLLTAYDLNDPEIAAARRLIHVPGAWNSQALVDGPIGAEGVVTYALRLRFDADADLPPYLAIRVPTPMNTAHALYIDGERVGAVGTLGLDRAETIPHYAPYTAIFAPQGDGATIILQMANFDHAYGGPVEPLTLGNRTQIEAQQQRQSGRNAFLLGSLFIMGLYHLGIFSLRRKDKAALYFGLFCLVSTAAILTFQYPELFTRYVNGRWSLFIRISLSLATTTMWPLTVFTHTLFPQESSSLALKTIGAATLIFVLSLLLLPIQLVTALILLVAIFLSTVLGYTSTMVVRAVVRGRLGARILLLAHIPLIATIVNDGLFFSGRLQTEQMAGVGILCFIFAQAYLLSVRFSNAFTRAEVLSEELRQSEEKYRAIFEESRDLILTTNRNGAIDSVNGAALDLLGYTPADLVACPLADLFARPEDANLLLGALAASDAITEFAADLRHRNGTIVPCGISASRRGDERGGALGFQAIVRDMRVYRQAEAERERSLLLQKDKEKAEAASKAKSDFLATMSHELRTPLNSILGYAQILQDQTRLTTFQQRSVQTILSNGRHLLNLIQDILDLSRIEANRLTIVYADVALYPLLSEVVGAVQVKAEEKKLGLSWRTLPEVPGYLYTDERRLRQILLNLLSNAVLYTEAGEVVLTVSCLNGETDPSPRIRFEVSDTGVGLPPEALARIFEPFEQVISQGDKDQGLGLGLSISRRLAKLLSGSIQVESTPGVGSHFRLELPGACAPETDSPEADSPEEIVVLAHPVAPDTAGIAQLLAPPPESLDEIDKLARLGDMVGVEAAARILASTHPQYQPFAEHVIGLARDFDDRSICVLVAELRNNARPPSQEKAEKV
jgi:PAS domain S-box-containing protein